MADYLPPVVTKLMMDIGDFRKNAAEAKVIIRSLADDIKDLNKDATIKLNVDKDGLAKAKASLDDMASSERKVGFNADLAASEINRLGLKADEAFIGGKAAVDDYQDKLKSLQRTLDGTWYDADKAAEEIRKIGLASDEAFIMGNIALNEYRENLRKLEDQLKDIEHTTLLSKLMSKIPWGRSVGLPGPLPNIPLAGVIPLLLGAVGIVGALSAEIGAIIAGFTAAGAAAGAFALFAIPAITRIYKALTADSSKGLHGILLTVYNDIQNIITEYEHLAHAFGRRWSPVALQLLDEFAKDAAKILPNLMPLANTAAKALSTLGGELQKAISGALTRPGHMVGLGQYAKEVFDPSAFQNAISTLNKYAGPALIAIGHGIAKVIVALGKFVAAWFKLMSVKDVVNGLNIFFGVLAGTITWVGKALLFLAANAMYTWDVFSRGVKDVRNWLHDANKIIDGFVTDGIKMFGIMRYAAMKAFDFIWHFIASKYDQIRHDTAAWIGDILRIAEAGWNWLIGSIIKTGHSIESNWDHAWTVVVNYVKGVPGMILRALGDLGSLLEHAGEAVINGFWSGMKRIWGDVTGWLSSLGGWISSLKGPIDYDRMLLVPHGHAIIQGLMNGMRAELPALWLLLKRIGREIPGGIMVPYRTGAYPGYPEVRMRTWKGTGYPAYGGYTPNQPFDVHVHVEMDGREIYKGIQVRAVRRQKRTGNNGLQRLTR